MDLDEAVRGLGSAFEGARENSRCSGAGHIHVTVEGAYSEDRLWGVLRGLLGAPDLFVIHHIDEPSGTAKITIYGEDAE